MKGKQDAILGHGKIIPGAGVERITVREKEVASGAHGAGMTGPTVL